MKNRDKFREEIINFSKLKNTEEGGKSPVCEFMKSNVLPKYTDVDCCYIWCTTCSQLFAFWLDEEYEEEHEVDWSKVDVDTLVRVRDHDYEEWTLKYFKGIDDELPTHRYVTWADGATSITAYGYTEHWTYCELVEHEDSSC